VTDAVAPYACPRCHDELSPVGDSLRCAAGHGYPIVSGIPRFVPSQEYSGSFGYQWKAFAKLQLDSYNGTRFSEERFRAITGWERRDLEGKRVLDAGCGAGRFAEVATRAFGARVTALDLSESVEACRENLMPDPPAVCQASIYDLPFREASFDFVYSIGVIQHTPDPARAVRSLCRMVKPGGMIALWIYEVDWKTCLGTTGFKYLLRPLVSRLPRARQIAFVKVLTAVFTPVAAVAKPLGLPGRIVMRLLPVASAYLQPVPLTPADFRSWVFLDTFDMYTPAYDQPQRFPRIARMLAEEGFEDIRRMPHGGVAIRATRSRS